jgi:murein DD-endopeptidase MepM/ murein hydrolase activator NlpD
MSLRRWSERVQAALAARRGRPPGSGLEVARQFIVVLVGLAGTAALIAALVAGPRPALPRPAPPAAAGPTRPQPATGSAAQPATPAPAATAAAPAAVPAAAAAPLRLQPPVAGSVVLPYGWAYFADLGEWQFHGAVSLTAPAGTAVGAAAPGTVTAVRDDPLWGWMVVVDHGGGVQTTYGSLGSVAVQPGQRLAAGAAVGTVGDSAPAEAALGDHLDFAVIRDGHAVDPTPLLPGPPTD